ncbi:MAG: hypothetical protein HDR80_06505 [Bacteroides sp.]|nr:hypothetical protein [Bacteroides sp.]
MRRQVADALDGNEAAVKSVNSDKEVLVLVLRSGVKKPQVVGLCRGAELTADLNSLGAHNSVFRARMSDPYYWIPFILLMP